MKDSEAKRIYDFIKQSYKRSGLDREYSLMEDWDDIKESEREAIKESLVKHMEFMKFNDSVSLLESLYENEEFITEKIKEENEQIGEQL